MIPRIREVGRSPFLEERCFKDRATGRYPGSIRVRRYIPSTTVGTTYDAAAREYRPLRSHSLPHPPPFSLPLLRFFLPLLLRFHSVRLSIAVMKAHQRRGALSSVRRAISRVCHGVENSRKCSCSAFTVDAMLFFYEANRLSTLRARGSRKRLKKRGGWGKGIV